MILTWSKYKIAFNIVYIYVRIRSGRAQRVQCAYYTCSLIDVHAEF